ncbi:MAG: hypothetical protein GY866_41880 [Proteobacteria bacterium]|nr:hypothetical protein [Pseudomonadota bacterium]
MHEKFSDHVEFLSIYIREAHPIDGWWFGKGIWRIMRIVDFVRNVPDLYDSPTIKERQKVASQCKSTLEYGITMYADDMNDSINKAYAAWQTRLYLIDKEGRIAYGGRPGPWGFKPGYFGQVIEKFLGL